MLQIKEYDLNNLDSELNNEIRDVDKLIKGDLHKISNIKIIDSFIIDLNRVIDFDSDFSFIKASISQVEKLKSINTKINIHNIKPFNNKLSLPISSFKKKISKADFTFNNIIEHIFGYHLEIRTQILKKILRKTNHQNCVYCLAQYTSSYVGNNNKSYVKGHLDHIHPKSLNALVSLSINNLVPVCAHCNQRKLNADLSKFNFNPFDTIEYEKTSVFNFKDVLEITNGEIKLDNLNNLKIENINSKLESRLGLTSLYKEYKSPIENLLDRYKKFNSCSYEKQIQEIIDKGISTDLEYFISETPYTEENIKDIPLHKFKSDFYKELEYYKKRYKLKFT